jgi:tRNA-splicing ligase RtcB
LIERSVSTLGYLEALSKYDHVSFLSIDVHLGKGVTIGTVFASEKYICPNAVGVDIGCGVAAIPIHGLYKDDLTHAQKTQIQQMIKERIPTGFNQHRQPLETTKGVLEHMTEESPPTQHLKSQINMARVKNQLGTLGGGNHFMEIVYAEDTNQVWVMLHSGSRNIGNRTAAHYDEIAKQMLIKHGVNVRPLNGINYMPIDSDEGQSYLRDMLWCQRYAFENRKAMKDIMLDVVHKVTWKEPEVDKAVNIHHNYCACEDCGNGRKLWVTRKGATAAQKGQYGIIPGSMGTGSYITRGLGDLQSWNSSPHGAGRRMSRTKAHRVIPQKAFESSMTGIVCDTNPNVKDEAPQAYKDLDEVMENSSSLTEIVHRLIPLVNVKGFEEHNNKYTSNQGQKKWKKH